jgi:hypothetical protein
MYAEAKSKSDHEGWGQGGFKQFLHLRYSKFKIVAKDILWFFDK